MPFVNGNQEVPTLASNLLAALLDRPGQVATEVSAIEAIPSHPSEEWEVLAAVAASLRTTQDPAAEIHLLRHLASRKY